VGPFSIRSLLRPSAGGETSGQQHHNAGENWENRSGNVWTIMGSALPDSTRLRSLRLVEIVGEVLAATASPAENFPLFSPSTTLDESSSCRSCARDFKAGLNPPSVKKLGNPGGWRREMIGPGDVAICNASHPSAASPLKNRIPLRIRSGFSGATCGFPRTGNYLLDGRSSGRNEPPSGSPRPVDRSAAGRWLISSAPGAGLRKSRRGEASGLHLSWHGLVVGEGVTTLPGGERRGRFPLLVTQSGRLVQ
jgi:hypothetical protein